MKEIKIKYNFPIRIEQNIGTEDDPNWVGYESQNEWLFIARVDEKDFVDYLFETNKLDESPYGWVVVKRTIENVFLAMDLTSDKDFMDWLYKRHYEEAQDECKHYMERF